MSDNGIHSPVPIAAKALCDHCGMTQRQVAEVLGLRTGVAVSCQLRKLSEQLKKDKKLKHIIEQIRKKMMPLLLY